MSQAPPQRVVLPQRRGVETTYTGKKSGLGPATQPLYAWVGTYFADRIQDVSVYFDDRSALTARGDDFVAVRVVFEVDEDFRDKTVLPDGLKLERLPSETLLLYTYEGPLTEFRAAATAWLERVTAENKLVPGYRQRFLEKAESPSSDGWMVELAVAVRTR